MENKAMSKFWDQYGDKVIAALLLLLMIGMYFLVKWLVKLSKKPKNTPYKPVYEVNPETGELVATSDADPLDGWKVEGLLQEMISVLESSYWFDASPRCEAYKKAAQLSDNQLIALANAYKNKQLSTLRQDMENTYGDGCTFYDSAWGDVLRDRMTSLDIP